jgi:hypothetical protein
MLVSDATAAEPVALTPIDAPSPLSPSVKILLVGELILTIQAPFVASCTTLSPYPVEMLIS